MRLLPELIRHYRNLLMVRVGGIILRDSSASMQKRYEEESGGYSESELLDCLDVLSAASDKMSSSIDREVTLELAVITLAGGRAGGKRQSPAETAAAKMATRPAPAPKAAPAEEKPAEEKKTETPPAVPADVTEPAEEPEEQLPPPEEEAPPAAEDTVPEIPEAAEPEPEKKPEGSTEGLLDGWDECVQVIRDKNRTLGALLKASRAHITATHLLIEANPMAIKFIRDNEESRTVIKEAVASVTGVRLPVGPWRDSTEKRKTEEDDGLDAFLNMAEEAGVTVIRN